MPDSESPAPHPAPYSPHHTLFPALCTVMTPKFFKTTEALRAWFTKHGATKTELWIGYFKKSSGRGGVVYKQALDEALCVGWIDGVVRSIDAVCYMQRWTPRKPKSNWSIVNVKRVGELIAEGRMKPAGLAAFARRVPERTGIYTFEKPLQDLPPAAKRRRPGEKARRQKSVCDM